MNESINKKLGVRIKTIRMQKVHENQDIFSERIGINRTYYASIEQGKHSPTVDLLCRIAKGLGVKLSELFEDLD